MSKPATVSRTTVNATSPMISAYRVRVPPDWAMDRLPPLANADRTSMRRALSAGNRPKNKLAPIPAAAVNNRTRAVHGDPAERKEILRNPPVHELERQAPNQQSGRAACKGEQQALDPELTENGPFRGTQRQPGRNLGFSAADPHQGQPGQVGTGDQQHKTHRCHQDHRRGACFQRQTLLERYRVVGDSSAGILLLHHATGQ